MSNKLKRKLASVQRSRTLNDKDWKLADKCFSSIFISMHLICLTALYSSKEDNGFDFSPTKLKNFNNFLEGHNRETVDGSLDRESVEHHFKKVGFNCEEKASIFPYRAKIKMFGGKLKSKHDYNVAISCTNIAIESYLALAVYTLHKHYYFSWNDIPKWWDKCVEIAKLYADGMTDEFVIQFIKDECDIDIQFE